MSVNSTCVYRTDAVKEQLATCNLSRNFVATQVARIVA